MPENSQTFPLDEATITKLAVVRDLLKNHGQWEPDKENMEKASFNGGEYERAQKATEDLIASIIRKVDFGEFEIVIDFSCLYVHANIWQTDTPNSIFVRALNAKTGFRVGGRPIMVLCAEDAPIKISTTTGIVPLQPDQLVWFGPRQELVISEGVAVHVLR